MPLDLAVVPVAGRGTRLLPVAKSQPKEMLPVGRKPVVQHVVEELALSGIRRVLFITGPGKTAIENHFDTDWELIDHLRRTGKEELLEDLEFERREMKYCFTRQRQQLGLGHAVLCARPFVGDQPFVVALGDSIIGLDAQSEIVSRMVDEYERSQADAVIAFEEVPPADVVQYGIARPKKLSGDVFELEDLYEKPARDEAPSNLAVAARYVCGPAIFEMLSRTKPGKGSEIQLTDAFRLLLKEGGKVLGVRFAHGERLYNIGGFESYFRAFTEFALADPLHGQSLREHLQEILGLRDSRDLPP